MSNFNAEADRIKLLTALRRVSKGIASHRTTLPILTCVKMEFDRQGLWLATTDLEVSIEDIMDNCLSSEARKFAVPCEQLIKVLSAQTGNRVVFSDGKDQNSFQIVCGKSKIQMRGLPVEDFPVIPEISEDQEGVSAITIRTSRFLEMIDQAAWCASRDTAFQFLNGVLINTQSTQLKLMACNSYVAAVVRDSLVLPAKEEIRALVPNGPINILARILDKECEATHILQSRMRNQISFINGSLVVKSRLAEDKYPDVLKIFRNKPPENELIVVRREDLSQAIRAVSPTMEDSNANLISLEILRDEIRVESNAVEHGSITTNLPIQENGSDAAKRFKVNGKYMRSVAQYLTSEEITLDVLAHDKSVIVRMVMDPGCEYLVMPIFSARDKSSTTASEKPEETNESEADES